MPRDNTNPFTKPIVDEIVAHCSYSPVRILKPQACPEPTVCRRYRDEITELLGDRREIAEWRLFKSCCLGLRRSPLTRSEADEQP